MMRSDVVLRVVSFVFIAANCDGQIGLRIRSERLNQLIERDAADFRWPAEVRVVRYGVADLREGEQLFASDVAWDLLLGCAQNIAAEFEIGWRRTFPSEPSVQRFLRRCYRAGCLGVRVVQVQNADETQRDRCDDADRNRLPPLFHADMLAHAWSFFTTICAPMNCGDAGTMRA
jgi:hypothetical protein